jgi:hypothetical protein
MLIVVLFSVSLFVAGCFGPPAPPGVFDVVLPGGAKQEVAAHTGPEMLAGGSWSGFRKAGGTEQAEFESNPVAGPYGTLLNGGSLTRPPVDWQIAVIDVAEDGRVTMIRENDYLLSGIYGDSSVVDGTSQSTTIFGLTYALTSFGVTVDDAIGVAVVSDVRFIGLPVGRAVIYAWGTGSTDRVDGQFGYLYDFSEGIGGLFFASGGDQYPFYLIRQE